MLNLRTFKYNGRQNILLQCHVATLDFSTNFCHIDSSTRQTQKKNVIASELQGHASAKMFVVTFMLNC